MFCAVVIKLGGGSRLPEIMYFIDILIIGIRIHAIWERYPTWQREYDLGYSWVLQQRQNDDWKIAKFLVGTTTDGTATLEEFLEIMCSVFL